jgi:hypothetical protein
VLHYYFFLFLFYIPFLFFVSMIGSCSLLIPFPSALVFYWFFFSFKFFSFLSMISLVWQSICFTALFFLPLPVAGLGYYLFKFIFPSPAWAVIAVGLHSFCVCILFCILHKSCNSYLQILPPFSLLNCALAFLSTRSLMPTTLCTHNTGRP